MLLPLHHSHRHIYTVIPVSQVVRFPSESPGAGQGCRVKKSVRGLKLGDSFFFFFSLFCGTKSCNTVAAYRTGGERTSAVVALVEL